MDAKTLTLFAGCFAVCRLSKQSAIPAWAVQRGWFNLTRTEDELSIMCEARQVPAGLAGERDFRLLKVEGPLPFSAVGVLARLTAVLAAAGVPILAVSTYDTDYLLVRESHLDIALGALRRADYEVHEREPVRRAGGKLPPEGLAFNQDTPL